MYSLVFQASCPPEAVYFTSSLVLNDVWDVWVLVIPVVVFPFGSFCAKQNSISQSAATGKNPVGVFVVSAFNLLKSSFKISIWEKIWLSEIFSVLL